MEPSTEPSYNNVVLNVIFETAVSAKMFFVDRVLQQAERENVNISGLEKAMLSFTESGDWEFGPEIVEQFGDEYDQDEYEQKVAGLLKRAYDQDLKEGAGPTGDAQTAYRAAYAKLREEDHFIMIMIDQVLRDKLRKKWLGIF